MIHHRTHPTPVDGCGPCRWATVGLANWARSAQGERQILRGAATELELGAYVDARKQGMQPRGTKLIDTDEAVRESRRLDRPWNAAEPVAIGEVVG